MSDMSIEEMAETIGVPFDLAHLLAPGTYKEINGRFYQVDALRRSKHMRAYNGYQTIGKPLKNHQGYNNLSMTAGPGVNLNVEAIAMGVVAIIAAIFVIGVAMAYPLLILAVFGPGATLLAVATVGQKWFGWDVSHSHNIKK